MTGSRRPARGARQAPGGAIRVVVRRIAPAAGQTRRKPRTNRITVMGEHRRLYNMTWKCSQPRKWQPGSGRPGRARGASLEVGMPAPDQGPFGSGLRWP